MYPCVIVSLFLLAVVAPTLSAPVEQRGLVLRSGAAAEEDAGDVESEPAPESSASASTSSSDTASGNSLVSTIGNGILGGLGSGLGSNIINEAVDGLKDLFNRTIEERELQHENRQLAGLVADIGESLLGGAAASVGSTLLGDAVGEVETLFNRTIEEREREHDSRQLIGLAADIGDPLLGGVATSAGSDVLGDAVNEVEKLVKRTVDARELEKLD